MKDYQESEDLSGYVSNAYLVCSWGSLAVAINYSSANGVS